MTISADTWAVVAATALGPVGAIVISFWREDRTSIRSGRLYVFRTLMATRKIPVSPDHVNALNLIEVNFYGCSKVEATWAACKEHLNNGPEDDAWREKKEKLLATMLSEMARVLKFNIPAMDIFKGGYAPGGWQHREALQFSVMDFLSDLAKGNKSFPIWVKGATKPPEE